MVNDTVRKGWRPWPLALVVVIVLAAVAGFLIRARSGSAAAVNTGSNSHVHTLEVDSNGFVILGDQDALYYGLPGGKSWTRYGTPLAHMMPLCVSHFHQVMLACTTDLSSQIVGKPEGLWRSTDGGKHWRRTSLPDLHVIAIATNPAVPGVAAVFAPSDGLKGGAGHGGIWVTTNDGQTWQRVNKARAFDALTGLALLPGKPFTVLFASQQALWRGTAGGRTWHTVSALSGYLPLSLAASPARAGTVFAGLNNGIWESDDSGASWRLRWSGGAAPLIRAAADRPDDVYAYIGTHLYRLTGSRRRQAADIAGQPGNLALDPHNASRVYVAYSFPLRVYRSDDGGLHWKQIV